MAEILENIAALLWIGLGILTGYRLRKLDKRMNKALDELDATFEQKEANGPW